VKLIVSRAALADLARLRDFLAARNPYAAHRAIDALIRAARSLDTSPQRGRPVGVPATLIRPTGFSSPHLEERGGRVSKSLPRT
jgi:plasmid stabilization system protein ParE